jgi:hypothetical protein
MHGGEVVVSKNVKRLRLNISTEQEAGRCQRLGGR